MSVLLTGGSGFLGRYIKISLKEKGFDIKTIGISATEDIHCNFAVDVPNLGSNYEFIIHAAGKAHVVPKSKAEADEFFQVNFEGTKNLLRGIEKSQHFPASFIFISTVAIYGLEKGEGITEDTARLATDSYGLSKIHAEDYLLEWSAKHGVKIGIIRPPLIVGRNAPGNLGAMIKSINNGLYFNIDNGKARRSMVLAEDLANFIPTIAKVGGIYHLTDGYHPSFGEISKLIAQRLNKRRIINIPNSFGQNLSKVGDLVQLVTRKECPINSRKFKKMTSSLTYSDSAARRIGWNPRKVLDNPDLWL